MLKISVKINDNMGYIDLYRDKTLCLKKTDVLKAIGYKNGFCARLEESSRYVITKKGSSGRLTDFVPLNVCSKFIKYLPCTALRRKNANRLSAFFDDLYMISANLLTCDDEEFVEKLSLDVDIKDDKKDDAQKKIELLQSQITMYNKVFAELDAIIEGITAKSKEGTC